MKHIQSYTPVSRPLSYDSLASRIGSETISGNPYLGWLDFRNIAVTVHNPNNYAFNQPDIVSYSLGPSAPGVSTKPFLYDWAAWVATVGVRIGQYGLITPPADTLGVVDALYPATKPPKLSLAFNDQGLLAMAITKSVGFIELKRYTDTGGTIATMSFAGESAVLFNNSLLDTSFKTKSGIIAFYLRSELPNSIFGRFEMDDPPFSVEHTLMPDLRTPPARIISVTKVERQQVLRYIDTLGRDVTLTSPIYSDIVDVDNKSRLFIQFPFGVVNNAGVPAPTTNDKARIYIALFHGLIYDATVKPTTATPSDTADFDTELDSGEIVTP